MTAENEAMMHMGLGNYFLINVRPSYSVHLGIWTTVRLQCGKSVLSQLCCRYSDVQLFPYGYLENCKLGAEQKVDPSSITNVSFMDLKIIF